MMRGAEDCVRDAQELGGELHAARGRLQLGRRLGRLFLLLLLVLGGRGLSVGRPRGHLLARRGIRQWEEEGHLPWYEGCSEPLVRHTLFVPGQGNGEQVPSGSAHKSCLHLLLRR